MKYSMRYRERRGRRERCHDNCGELEIGVIKIRLNWRRQLITRKRVKYMIPEGGSERISKVEPSARNIKFSSVCVHEVVLNMTQQLRFTPIDVVTSLI